LEVLTARHRTGNGQHIETTTIESALNMLGDF